MFESQIMSADMSVREISAARRRAKLELKRRASSSRLMTYALCHDILCQTRLVVPVP